MAITSEQIWDVAPRTTREPLGDAYVLGRPARPGASEPSHLIHEIDWNHVVHSATAGFFDDRDPGCSIRSTLAKILGVIIVLSGIVLITLGMLAVLGLWTLRAALG